MHPSHLLIFLLILSGYISLFGCIVSGKGIDSDSGENTFYKCQDGKDNDSDCAIDCADQDCQIFTACVSVGSDEDAGTVKDIDTDPDTDVDSGT